MRKKGFLSLVAVGVLSSSLSVGSVKAEENDYEITKKAVEGQIEKQLKSDVVDWEVLSRFSKEVKDSRSTKSSDKVSTMSNDYIFEQEYNDTFASANLLSYQKPTIGQLLPLYDVDMFKVVVPSNGVLLVGGDTNSYAIDLGFFATEKDFAYSDKLVYLGTEYENEVEIQVYQAKAGTYYVPVFDYDYDYYDDNTEEDLYVIATQFVSEVDDVAPSKPTVNKVDNNDKKITGKAEANSTITVKNGSTKIGSATVTSNGTFSVVIKPQKAGTKLSVNAKDSAGNVSSNSYITVVDGTPPAQPTVNKVDSNDRYVKGKAERYSTVYVKRNGRTIGTATANSKGSYAVKINPLKAGTILAITAKDKAGNISPKKTTKVVKP